ncbi:hypothetical protein CHUAL_003498 [Chamberlinius hualienensis]
MMSKSLLAAVLLSIVFHLNNAQSPMVSTTSGHLKGTTGEVSGRPLMKFFGVPYAKPPIRFSPAEEFPTEQMEKTIDSDHFRHSCIQPPHLRKVIYRPLHSDLDETLVSEDCLNLNIYVPGRKINESNDPMAVMVWLPGEGFDFGFANQYDGSRLAVHGQVIVVTVNYRLSVFGFLSTGDNEAPGNLGLKDQLMALKWLKKNIAQMGGDPQRITLFGRLTGSMSISALMSTAEGPEYFQRVILQSGVAHGEWTFETKPLEQAELIGSRVGCGQPSTDKINTTRLINCLRKVPAKTLLKVAIRSPRPWRLTLENSFLAQTPLKRASQPFAAKIDVMLGTNEHEGSVCLLSHLAQKTEYMDKFLNNTLSNDDLRHLVHSHVDNYYGMNEDNELREAVHSLYKCTSNEESLEDCRQQFLAFCGDLYSHATVTELADKLVKSLPTGSNVYRYEFAHRPTFSHYPEFVGAAQGDEVLFVFGLVDEEARLGNIHKDEIELGRTMMTMWTNFAKSGNPNVFQDDVYLPKYNDNSEYLRITRKMSPQSIQKSATNNRIDFWINLNDDTMTSSTTS